MPIENLSRLMLDKGMRSELIVSLFKKYFPDHFIKSFEQDKLPSLDFEIERTHRIKNCLLSLGLIGVNKYSHNIDIIKMLNSNSHI